MKRGIWPSMVLIFCSSCVSLQQVGQFSDKARTTVELYPSIGFSASSYCEEYYCMDPQVYLTGTLRKKPDCSCQEFSSADKSIQQINVVLRNYFAAVVALAGKSISNSSWSGFSGGVQALAESTRFGVSKEEVKAVADVSSELSALALSHHRYKTLKKLIENSDPRIAAIIDGQIRNMKGLQEMLARQQDEDQLAIYSMSGKTSDTGVKYLLTRELQKRKSLQTSYNHKLKKFIDGLSEMKNAHHQLYLHKENLKDPDFRKTILDHASAMQKIIQDFVAVSQ